LGAKAFSNIILKTASILEQQYLAVASKCLGNSRAKAL
jgi:hypothetical protein